MPRKRTKKEEVAHETTTRVAEGIGQALGRIVNRLGSLTRSENTPTSSFWRFRNV